MEDLVTEFNGKLAQPMKAGDYFDIEVQPIKDVKRFHISLANAKLNEHPQADIGLQIEVNFAKKQITANTRFGGRWGNDVVEDCQISEPLANNNIRINIQMWDNIFQVSLDGKHQISMFNRRHDQALEAVQVGGDVKLITRVDHRQVYPKLWPPSATVAYYVFPTYFSNDIPIQFKPGHLTVITARCFGDPQGEFYINLKHAHNETLLMHFIARFSSKMVGLNYLYPSTTERYGQIWGKEEQGGGFPFDFHKPFRMGIAFRENDLVVAVNGLYFCSYAYRDPENRFLTIVGTRPYSNVLSNIVGLKVYARPGAGIKITEADHIQLSSPQCNDFEKYTKMERDMP